METIEMDYKQQNWKILTKYCKPFNCDIAPLNSWQIQDYVALSMYEILYFPIPHNALCLPPSFA